jgi:hypothetical protein
MAGAPAGEAPVQIVGGAVAVERYADLHRELEEEVEVRGVETDSVGVNTQVRVNFSGQPRLQQLQQGTRALHAIEQRLAPVQDDRDPPQRVRGAVFCDAVDDARGRLLAQRKGSAAPRLVGVFVDVAVVAGQVTSAVQLQHVLPERQYRGAGDHCRGASRIR